MTIKGRREDGTSGRESGFEAVDGYTAWRCPFLKDEVAANVKGKRSQESMQISLTLRQI